MCWQNKWLKINDIVASRVICPQFYLVPIEMGVNSIAKIIFHENFLSGTSRASYALGVRVGVSAAHVGCHIRGLAT